MMKFSKNKDAAKRRTRRRSGGSGLLRSVGVLLLAACLLTLIPMGAFADDPAPEATSVPVGSNNDNVYAVINGIATIANGDPTDLENYIAGMKLQKKDANGNWVEFEDGDQIVVGNNYKLSVHFEAGSGGFESPMHWSLGNSVECKPVTNAPIMQGNTVVGYYDLTKDGNVTVRFTEEFLKGGNQQLDMNFDMVAAHAPGQGHDPFPWDGLIKEGTTLTNEGQLDVQKVAGSFHSSSNTIDYAVAATVTQGMVTDGYLKDTLGASLAAYGSDNMQMHVYDANGKDVTAEYQSYIDVLMKQAADNKGSKTRWTLSPLPPMTQGMRFEITYRTKVDDAKLTDRNFVAENTVEFGGMLPSGDKAEPDTAEAKKPLAKDQLSKSGNVITVGEDEVIQWTVRVGSGQWDPFGDDGHGDLTIVDTLGTGLSFRQDEPFVVQWCDKDGKVKGTYNITKGEIEYKPDKDGKLTATYHLKDSYFSEYDWADGDYLQVTYNTNFDAAKQPSTGFENFVKNDVLAPDGTKGKVPVGEAIQKSVTDPDGKYLNYTVQVDVPAAGDMKPMGSDADDHTGHPYFYILDRLEFDGYYAMNVPENIQITAHGKYSNQSWTFENVPYESGNGDGNEKRQTYQVMLGAEDTTSYKVGTGNYRREFRIYFNTACYGIGGDNKLDYHDSVWNIDEATVLTITYRIPYDTPLVDKNGVDTGLTLGELLNRGMELTNHVRSVRKDVPLKYDCYYQKAPTEGSIDKQARVLSGDVVEYTVSFNNSYYDATDNETHRFTDLHTSDVLEGNTYFSDVFDERMVYVPGTLRVEVRNVSGDKLYANYKYTGPNPVSGNTITAYIYDNANKYTLWEQDGNDGTHYTGTNSEGEINNRLPDTFDGERKYVFVYQLRLKDDVRKNPWDTVENIKNEATFTYGKNHPSDDAHVDLPSNMLQKDVQPGDVAGWLKYTLSVNEQALNLVSIETSEGFVNLDSFKLVDEMSENLVLMDEGDYVVQVQYRDDADSQWKDLTRSPSTDGISKGKLNYFRGTDENGDLYFILPDELAIRIVYQVKVNGPADSEVLANNKATLYADYKETDERNKVMEVGSSSASASSDPTVRLQKWDITRTKQLKGAVFTLYSDKAKESGDFITVKIGDEEVTLYEVKIYTTDDFGQISKIEPLENDTEGLYALVESKAPEGYTMTDDPIFFRFPNYEGTAGGTVDYRGKPYIVEATTANHTFEVEDPPVKNLQVVKTDAASDPKKTDYFLGGAEFELRKGSATGEVLYTGTSREAGGVIEWKQTGTAEAVTELHLDEGTYVLVETDAPEGYIKLADPVQFKVDANGNIELVTEGLPAGVVMTDDGTPTVTITIPNQSGYVLPESGGMGTTVLYALGAALVLSAAMALVCDNRRRRAKG